MVGLFIVCGALLEKLPTRPSPLRIAMACSQLVPRLEQTILRVNNQSEITNQKSALFLAERVGFEPTERFPAHSISSAANSTTLAPLQHCQFAIANCQLVTAGTDLLWQRT